MPQSNRQIGADGEQMAIQYLINKGFEVLVQGYRFKRAEADLIVRNQKLLVFVEVKIRKGHRFGYPEQFVTDAQANRLHNLASHYIERFSWQGMIRFDIVAIEKTANGFEVLHIEDAF